MLGKRLLERGRKSFWLQQARTQTSWHCRTCLQDYVIQVSRSSGSFSRKLKTKTLFYLFYSNCRILDECPTIWGFSESQGLETSCALFHNVGFELEGRLINLYIWSQWSLDDSIVCQPIWKAVRYFGGGMRVAFTGSKCMRTMFFVADRSTMPDWLSSL